MSSPIFTTVPVELVCNNNVPNHPFETEDAESEREYNEWLDRIADSRYNEIMAQDRLEAGIPNGWDSHD